MDKKITEFFTQRSKDIEDMAKDNILKELSLEWMLKADRYKYTYNFTWMGRPIIKYPNDMIVQQELMWQLKPDLIVETGVAHGGSIIFSASMMRMMGIEGNVIGIDIDIRKHNLDEIENGKTTSFHECRRLELLEKLFTSTLFYTLIDEIEL